MAPPRYDIYVWTLPDRHSSPYTCAPVGYLLETNVLRGVEDACSTQSFCWGNRDPDAINTTITYAMSRFRIPYSVLKISPSAQVPRSQYATWLARALNGGVDPPAPPVGTPSPFTDVNDTQAWWPHVVYLANHPNVGSIVLGYSGGTTYPSTAPASFFPSNPSDTIWAAVLLKNAFGIPSSSQFSHVAGVHYGGYYKDISNYVGHSVYNAEIREAIYGMTQAGIASGFNNCAVVQLRSRGGTDFRACNFKLTRKSSLAKMLAYAMAWSGIQPSTPGLIGQSVPGLYVRTTKASEVINLLPEYFIGKPELPIFADQIYKTDSFLNKPSNF